MSRTFLAAVLLLALVAPVREVCVGDGTACSHDAGTLHRCCQRTSAAPADAARSCCAASEDSDSPLLALSPAAARPESCGCMHSPGSALPEAIATEAVETGQNHDAEPCAAHRHDVEGMRFGLHGDTVREGSRDRSPPIFLVTCAFLT